MRILYLSYTRQNSFQEFCSSARTNCTWIDALLDEMVKCQDISVGLAVPVKSESFQTGKGRGISLYGLPNGGEVKLVRKIYNRIANTEEGTEINYFARQAIEEFKPDIIQIFGSENPLGLILKDQNIPGIIHIQGYLNVWQGKWFTGISKAEQYRYSALRDLILRRGIYHEYFAFRKRAEREEMILGGCRHFMGRTNFDRKLAALFSPDSKYFHCEEFIRNVFFERQWDYPLNDEVICLSILKGTSYKGIDLLIEVSILLRKYSSHSFRFRICGVSPDEEVVVMLKKKYRNEFKDLNIEFLGKLNAAELAEHFCNANFYIHPSYIENSPNSVCEAMASGMPVISTNVGGTSSLINDNVDGILVQEGEPYSMAAAVCDLINDYKYAELLGENARKRALIRHNPDNIVRQLLDIYQTILIENERK